MNKFLASTASAVVLASSAFAAEKPARCPCRSTHSLPRTRSRSPLGRCDAATVAMSSPDLLMTVLFAVGVMNLLWVVALTAIVLIEKLGPAGPIVARLAGAAMIAGGIIVLA